MIRNLSLILLCTLNLYLSASPSSTISNIHIDQFGYRENAEKIAIISQAQTGFNAPDTFTPSETYQIRNWDTDAVAFSGIVTLWKNGSTHNQSGDKVWHFDFSTLTTPGEYYVWDVTNKVGSYRFAIDNDIYNHVLKHAMRTFYYQRFGYAKEEPYAEKGWTDAASHMGPQQDTDCRNAKNPIPETSRDLRGGWYDAGDYNKYMNYADETVCNLLAAYDENPSVFTDDYNIPESGNGIEDILDEIKYELDWMLRMQENNGSCIHKVSNTCYCDASPPSADKNFHRYLAPTLSATISGCVTYAYGALIYKKHKNENMQLYGDTLEKAALNAWKYIKSNHDQIPSKADNSGFENAAIEDNEYQQRSNVVVAASFLYALTSNETYSKYVDSVWNSNYIHLKSWTYASIFEEHFQDALLYYAGLPNATQKVADEINSIFTNSMLGSSHYGKISSNSDAYLSYGADGIHTWGSNRNKCQQGSMYYSLVNHQLDTSNNQKHKDAAERFIHYMHGVNPMNLTYLTNMSKYGAENSVTEIYHAWFADGNSKWDKAGVSTYGPAPGFVPGGVNPKYAPNASCKCDNKVSPPLGQPILKSYKDWNANWPEDSWEVTENSISYQAAYVRLISKFVGKGKYLLNTHKNTTKQHHDLLISPNPTSSHVQISGWDKDGILNITNQSGQIIHSIAIKANTIYSLKVNFPIGIYFVKASLLNGSYRSGKLIINK